MKLLPLRLSAISATLLLLAACGGESNSSTSEPAVNAVTKMSTLTPGFQTFKPREHSLTGYSARSSFSSFAAPQDDGVSQYVYENPETNEVSTVVFETEDGSTDKALRIETIVDLNEKYSAINISNISIKVGDRSFTGNYTLIQDKTTGALYPLVENGQPIYKTVEAEHEAWITNTRFSNNADMGNIYLRHGEAKSLHRAKLNNHYFEISKIFDDYLRDDVILTNGDIVTRRWDEPETLTWRESNGAQHDFAYDASLTTPFLHDGKLYAIHQTDETLIELSLNGNTLEETDALWTINGYRPWPLSVVRGDYKMHSNCSIYQFNNNTKTITQLAAHRAHNGYVANAGQNAMYCMYSATDANDARPSFVRFDIKKATLGQPAITSVNASSGTKLDANERMAVVSDNELMFYQYPSGTFTEYYVNFDAGTTVEKEVNSITTIKMQTITQI